jgi:hypothetical protein
VPLEALARSSRSRAEASLISVTEYVPFVPSRSMVHAGLLDVDTGMTRVWKVRPC